MRKLIWLALAFLCFSCTNTAPDPIILSSVTSNYEIFAAQQLTPNGPICQISIQTIDPSNCLNDKIDATISNSIDKILLEIDGIIEGEPCDMGASYPEMALDLSANLGEIPFEIKIPTFETITGTINFEDQAIFITPLSSQAVEVKRDHIFKVPMAMGWGYIDETSSTGLDITEIRQFFNLNPNANPDFNLIGDDYGFFMVDENGAITVSNLPAGADQFIFDARDETFWDDLELKLDQIKDKYPDIDYSFFRWDGAILEN